jgi:hypothetical protein
MSNPSVKPPRTNVNRHNIAMDGVTRDRAEKLAEADKRSVSNLLAVLVDREWERQFPPAPTGADQSQAEKEGA